MKFFNSWVVPISCDPIMHKDFIFCSWADKKTNRQDPLTKKKAPVDNIINKIQNAGYDE